MSTQPAASGRSPEEARAVADYLDWLEPKRKLASDSLLLLSALLKQAGDAPNLLFNDKWRADIAVPLTMLDVVGNELQRYPRQVPVEANRLDGLVKEMGRDLVYISRENVAGLERMDAVRITNAKRRLDASAERANQTVAEIQSLRAR